MFFAFFHLSFVGHLWRPRVVATALQAVHLSMHESSHRIGDSYRFQTVPNPEDNEQPDHVSRPGSACSDSTPPIWKASQLESCCEFEVLHEAALNDLDCLELGPQK